MFISLHLCNSSKQTCKHKSKSFSWNKHLRDFVWRWIRLNIPFCSWQNCAGFQGLSCSISTQLLRHSIGHALVAKALPLVNVEPSERHESIRGPTGTKKIVSNDSTSEQDVQGSLFNKFAHGCRGCASSISKPKNTFHDHQWFDCLFSLSSTNALCFPICSNAHGFQATISQVWVVLSNQTYPPCRRHVHKRGFADRSVPDELKTFTQ